MSSISDYSYLFTNTGTNDYSAFSSSYWGNYSSNRTSSAASAASTETTSSSTTKSNKSSNVLDEILYEKKYPTASKSAQEANTSLTSGISSLNSSLSTLQSSLSDADEEDSEGVTDSVVSALKDYVSNYNDVISAAKGSTLTGKTAYVSNIMTTTAANTDKLSEIGITVNSDGSLDIDEDTLKAADLSKVEDLFSSDSIISYGSTVASRLKFAGAASDTSSTSTSGNLSITSTTATASTSAADLKADARLLASDSLYEKVKDEDGNETDEYDVDSIYAAAKSFVSNYNKMFDAAESSSNSGVQSNLSYIRKRTASNEDTLAQFGISVNSNGRLAIDEDTFRNSDMSKVQEFFKNYGSSVATNASLVNYYMSTQAGASSGYTSSGAYNVQSSASYETVA